MMTIKTTLALAIIMGTTLSSSLISRRDDRGLPRTPQSSSWPFQRESIDRPAEVVPREPTDERQLCGIDLTASIDDCVVDMDEQNLADHQIGREGSVAD